MTQNTTTAHRHLLRSPLVATGKMETKQALRAAMKAAVATVSEARKATESLAVARTLLQHDRYRKAQRVGVFLSMSDEVNTTDIVKDIFASGKECFVPRYTKEGMDLYRIADMDDLLGLPRTKWNISQPEDIEQRENALADGKSLDLVILPGLAFSKDGRRLGRGKGYYDQYCKRCVEAAQQGGFPRPYFLGVGFSVQQQEDVPTTELDFQLDEVLFGSGAE